MIVYDRFSMEKWTLHWLVNQSILVGLIERQDVRRFGRMVMCVDVIAHQFNYTPIYMCKKACVTHLNLKTG